MLVIDQAQNNGAIDVSSGDAIEVRLHENPTTGYRWHLQSDGAPALRLLQDLSEAPTASVGAGGQRSWKFVAEDPGSAELRMDLRRSWQPQSVNSFAVVVNVKARSTTG